MVASEDDLKDVFIKQVRSVLELAVPVWNAAIRQEEKRDIERVQKLPYILYWGILTIAIRMLLILLNWSH